MKPRLLKLWGYAIVACLLAALLLAVINPGVISAVYVRMSYFLRVFFSVLAESQESSRRNPYRNENSRPPDDCFPGDMVSCPILFIKGNSQLFPGNIPYRQCEWFPH